MATLLKCVGKSGKIPSRDTMLIEEISRKVLENSSRPRDCSAIIDKHKKELKKRKIKKESHVAYFLRSCCYDVTNIPDFVAFNTFFEEMLTFYRVTIPSNDTQNIVINRDIRNDRDGRKSDIVDNPDNNGDKRKSYHDRRQSRSEIRKSNRYIRKSHIESQNHIIETKNSDTRKSLSENTANHNDNRKIHHRESRVETESAHSDKQQNLQEKKTSDEENSPDTERLQDRRRSHPERRKSRSENRKSHHDIRQSQYWDDNHRILVQHDGYLVPPIRNKPNIPPDVLSVAFRGCLAAIKWTEFEVLTRLVDYIKHNEDALKEVFHNICSMDKQNIFEYMEFFIPYLPQTKVQNSLHTAIMQHNMDLVKIFCEISQKNPELVDLNQRNEEDRTPVIEALSWKFYDALEILITSGCDARNCLTEMRTFSFNTLFPWDEVYGRKTSPMFRCLTCLFENGVDLEITDKGGSTLMETAIYLINYPVTYYLLKRNFRVTKKCLEIIHQYYFPLYPPMTYSAKAYCKIYIIAAISKASGDMSIRDKLDVFPLTHQTQQRRGHKKAANDMITLLKSRSRLSSLQDLCRLKIRFEYGVSLMKKLEPLNVPESIRKFLKFEDITKLD